MNMYASTFASDHGGCFSGTVRFFVFTLRNSHHAVRINQRSILAFSHKFV